MKNICMLFQINFASPDSADREKKMFMKFVSNMSAARAAQGGDSLRKEETCAVLLLCRETQIRHGEIFVVHPSREC